MLATSAYLLKQMAGLQGNISKQTMQAGFQLSQLFC